jgi:hypothetical protein
MRGSFTAPSKGVLVVRRIPAGPSGFAAWATVPIDWHRLRRTQEGAESRPAVSLSASGERHDLPLADALTMSWGTTEPVGIHAVELANRKGRVGYGAAAPRLPGCRRRVMRDGHRRSRGPERP